MRFTRVKLPNGNTIIDTGLPQRNIKPAGLNHLIHMSETLFTAVSIVANQTNGVIVQMSDDLVNAIYDMSMRDEALEHIHQALDEALGEDGGASLDSDERMRTESRIWSANAQRVVAEHMDTAFGVTHRLAIGTFGTADTGAMGDGEEPPADAELGEEWKSVDTA